jgi:hypothetical protein
MDMDPALSDPLEDADLCAVLRRLTEGTPLEPEVAQRVQQRARRITEALQRRAPIDIEKLLRDAR